MGRNRSGMRYPATSKKFDEAALYKINAVTTLVSAYRDDHPGTSLGEAEAAVNTFLARRMSICLTGLIIAGEP